MLAVLVFSISLLIAKEGAKNMAYADWRKGGKVLFACRVAGLALEALLKADASIGEARPSLCGHVEFWKTEELSEHGTWSRPKSRVFPVLPVHQNLAFYILQRIYQLLAGPGLSVVNAIVPKTAREGCGHHDLMLKHALAEGAAMSRPAASQSAARLNATNDSSD